MADDINQKISCFIDDELKHNEALDLLKECQSNSTLKNKLNRYQTISYCLSSKKVLPIRKDFLGNVKQGISKDPLYFPAVNLQSKRSYKTFMALAACVSLIAILVTKSVEETPLKVNTVSSSTMAAITTRPKIDQQKTIKLVSHTPQKPKQKNNHNNRFNDYLQAHNTSLYTNSTVIFQPFTQTASYEQN
jgi:sigma-E factor negative regulatory protein RseA